MNPAKANPTREESRMEATGESTPLTWRQATDADLDLIKRSALTTSSSHGVSRYCPEKFNLFPEGCLVLEHGGRQGGYSIRIHGASGTSLALKPLNSVQPSRQPSDCLFIHDLAVLPRARGFELTYGLMENHRQLAWVAIPCLALVSVYGRIRCGAVRAWRSSPTTPR
jgi:hypothetical protein